MRRASLILLLLFSQGLRSQARAAETDPQRARLLVELLIESRRYGEAETFLRDRRKRRPKEPLWVRLQAELDSARDRPLEAARRYRELIALEGSRPETLKRLGQESLYGGELAAAKDALLRAREGLPGDPEIPYELCQTAFESGDAEEGRRWAHETLNELGLAKGGEAERLRLRMEARLGWSQFIGWRYRKLAKKRPGDEQLLVDWLDGLLENSLTKEMEEPLKLLSERFPNKRKACDRYRYEMALKAGDWRKIMAALEASTRRGPAAPAPGRLRIAMALMIPFHPSLSKPDDEREMLMELRHGHDSQVGGTFRYYRLPSETSYESGLTYAAHLSLHTRLEAEAVAGDYRVPGRSFHGTAQIGQAKLSYDPSPSLRAGLWGGFSAGAPKDSLSPGAFAAWRPSEAFEAHASYRHHRFWNEFAEAVAAGALADDAQATFSAAPWKHVYLGGNYQYNHYRTKGGLVARRTEAAPEGGFVILERPRLTMGYQFVMEDADGEDAFFNEVPLLRRARTHFMALNFSHWLVPGALRAEAYFLNGQDSGRGFRFERLDLTESGASVHWDFRPGFGAHLAYEFGKEAPTGFLGQSHTVRLILEARWKGYVEKNSPDR